MKYALFDGLTDKGIQHGEGDWDDIVKLVRDAPVRESKSALPLLKLAEFGDEPTNKGTMRHEGNIISFSGLEADYDDGEMGIQEAYDRLMGAGIKCALYTTPTHTEEKPRWRVIAPFFEPADATVRTTALNRLNGVLGGVLAPESWTLAQSFFIGNITGKDKATVMVTDGDCGLIDAMFDLDAGAIGKGAEKASTVVPFRPQATPGRKYREGERRHDMLKAEGARLRNEGLEADEIFKELKNYVHTHFVLDNIDWEGVKSLADWFGEKESRELGDLNDFTAMPYDPESENNLVRELSKWAFLTHNDKFYKIESGEMVSAATFDLTLKNGLNFRAVNPVTNREKTFLPREYFLSFCQDRVVHMPMYAPVFGLLFEFEGIKRINSYKPDQVPEADPQWRERDCWKIIQNHYIKLFENPDVGHKLLQWMAYNVQKTGHKILWAPIVCGVQGDGKSSIANILRACMGANIKEIGAGDVKSSFNDWAEGAAVVAMEELRVKGHNRHDVMNALKPLISNPTVSINKKGIGRYESQNVTNYIAFTNYEDALVLDENDRRWEAFFTRYTKREDMLRDFSNFYWESFHGAYRDNPGIIRGWLMEYDISDFDPNMPPSIGGGNARMIEAAKPDIQIAIEELMLNMPDFFTVESLRSKLAFDFPRFNSVQIGKELGKNPNFEDCKIIKVASKAHKFWAKAEAYKLLKHMYKDKRDFDKELNKACRECHLKDSDHAPF